MSAGNQPWYLRVPEGQVYGPVEKTTLDQWVQQGRADAQCYVGRSAQGPWEPIEKYYPHLKAPAAQGGSPPPMGPPETATPGAGPTAAPPGPLPGKLEAVRIMAIVGGALAILTGVAGLGWTLVAGIASFGIGCLCLPIPVYWLVTGIIALTQGINVAKQPPKVAAIMQIICVLGGDVINLVLGIIELVFLNDPEIRAYYHAQGITY